MADQVEIGATYDERFDPEALREREADYTPRPVVEQLVDHLADVGGLDPIGILDPSAGSGVFGQVCRAKWPVAYVVSVEPRDAERETLQAQARAPHDSVHSCTLADFAGRNADRYELIASNPPFSRAIEFVETLRPMLRSAGLLVFLLPARWALRGEERAAWLLEHHEQTCDRCEGRGEINSADGRARHRWIPIPCTTCCMVGRVWEWPNLPAQELVIPGPIKFRGKAGGADLRDYSWHVWTRDATRTPAGEMPCVITTYLPWLPGHQRQWTTRPGTET